MRKYGWKRDLFDGRDKHYKAIRPTVTLPDKVDMRSWCSKVEDQGNIGSCTGNATVGALELLENKDQVKFTDFSRLFAYYNARLLENNTENDDGAYIRDVIKGLAKYGICHESTWPYMESKFADKPSLTAYSQALAHQVKVYHRIDTLDEILTALATNFPVIFGFTVYESFESDIVAQTGIMPMPGPGEQELGGHAVCAVGHDNNVKRLLVRNSWGENWGLKGYFWMPFEAVETGLTDDHWVVQAGEQI